MFIRTKVDWRLSLLFLAAMGRIQASEKGEARGKRQALYPPPLVYPLGGILKYRVNFKVTMFPYTTIFSHAAGFKLVWLLPTGSEITRFVRSVDDVHQAAKIVYESHGFDGRSCLLKNICQAMEYVSQRDGVIAKILKLLAGSHNGTTGNPVYCDVHVRRCPLELIGVDYFTGR